MDYSASIQDADHPAGGSPWGNSPASSPQAHRTTFGAVADEAPASPTPFGSQIPSNGFAATQDEGGFGATDHGFERPGTSNSVAESDTHAHTTETAAGDVPAEQQQSGPFGGENVSPSQAHDPNQSPVDSARASQVQPQARKSAQPMYKLQAKITGLERAARKDPILRFDVHTNLPKFRTTQFRDVRRLHSEFVKLAEHLISANPEALVPAVPPPLTSAGAGTDEDEIRVKALMQRWFNYVCSNEVLARDDEMVLFVESDFGYSPMIKKRQPATGVRRKLLKQFAPPPDDTPELSEARPIVKLFYLGSMDAGHKVDKLVKSRLGLSQSEFGVRLGGMHIQEPHQGLANAYRKLGKFVQTVGDSQQAQATAEAFTIGDPFQYHSSDAFIVKETLTNRQLLIREFLQAQENSRGKLNAADRLKASSNVRREKVDEAITALEDAKQSEAYLYQKTQRVTQNLVHERRKWFARTTADLRASIREFVCKEIEAERRTLALLENVRPDVRAIDASGGLSRLGREAHPVIRRSTLASSQGPKGDAWSGVPRRSVDTMGRSMSGSFMSNAAEEGDAEEESARSPAGGLPGLSEEDDEDRVDARNAASRLATSTF
ncbi:Vacuolar protein sorting-associated protein 17 [Cytospora mali]|uniref:Vacuolar protein sorting-associated protein 17 n=1 Tax=Cytospora mali TaxID=578113 RepID=A0A194UTR4_CYTMA|nr:Vacuolar protein sorting-associated protein 17 [Valsa mali var. pyri (nom. inval.)]